MSVTTQGPATAQGAGTSAAAGRGGGTAAVRPSLLARLLGRGPRRDPGLTALYAAIVAAARDPGWYREGGVPDTLDGRFDMVAAVLALVLLRLEAEGQAGAEPAARLTEIFVDDMDGQLRQQGIGDIVVGKHVGRMMGALGGRLTAYRAGLAGEAALDAALVRNLYRGKAPARDALDLVEIRIRAFAELLATRPLGEIVKGRIGVKEGSAR